MNDKGRGLRENVIVAQLAGKSRGLVVASSPSFSLFILFLSFSSLIIFLSSFLNRFELFFGNESFIFFISTEEEWIGEDADSRTTGKGRREEGFFFN